MSTITSGKALIIATNGYIALWLVGKLPGQGYAVRGTIRSKSKAEQLRETFCAYDKAAKFIVVDDLTKEGVDAIAYRASPVVIGIDEPEELIAPAVRGTMRVLEPALVHGTSVKHMVLTSSCAAFREFRDLPRTFTEADWNDTSLAEVHTHGRTASIADECCASKILAERAA